MLSNHGTWAQMGTEQLLFIRRVSVDMLGRRSMVDPRAFHLSTEFEGWHRMITSVDFELAQRGVE